MAASPLSDAVARTLDEFMVLFGQRHIHHPAVAPGLAESREASVHSFISASWPPRDFPDFGTARRWFAGRNVAFFRQPTPTGAGRYILAPMAQVRLAVGYHATRLKNWPDIRRAGLLPGDPDEGRASTSGRFDCVGYIYVCPDLGSPADMGRNQAMTAHWWRGQLAHDSSTDPHQDWMVLGIDLTDLRGCCPSATCSASPASSCPGWTLSLPTGSALSGSQKPPGSHPCEKHRLPTLRHPTSFWQSNTTGFCTVAHHGGRHGFRVRAVPEPAGSESASTPAAGR